MTSSAFDDLPHGSINEDLFRRSQRARKEPEFLETRDPMIFHRLGSWRYSMAVVISATAAILWGRRHVRKAKA